MFERERQSDRLITQQKLKQERNNVAKVKYSAIGDMEKDCGKERNREFKNEVK